MSININDVLDLARAGYNREEIAALLDVKPEEKPAEQKPEEKPEDKPAEQKPEEKHSEPETGIGSVLAELQKLNKAITDSNIIHSNQPPQESAEDIIAAIIRPPRKE